ncbi:hypothetical protein BDV39DRAFT_88904 [Aspergillus sergii]|uniref:Secreted protein n=1 Tax=Aspergillus sergii TaxID=1034303 RepID=A0A5N6X2T3_9EURO|nr:hypothetical protein BDV39DRAFT_88904 [Aspergillus sergii]
MSREACLILLAVLHCSPHSIMSEPRRFLFCTISISSTNGKHCHHYVLLSRPKTPSEPHFSWPLRATKVLRSNL